MEHDNPDILEFEFANIVYMDPIVTTPIGWKCPVCGVGVHPRESVCSNCVGSKAKEVRSGGTNVIIQE